MAVFLRKYGVTLSGGTVIRVPIVKRGVVDFAVGADWTPATGDVKVSKDGGAAANIGTLPTAVAMGNGAFWEFTLTGTELSAQTVVVTVADSATKAVEDQCFVVETYGNASAMYQADLSAANLPANAVQIGGTAQTGRDLGASVLLSSGTGTGQVSLSSGKIAATLAAADVTGNVAADLQTIKTQAVTAAAGVTFPTSVGTSTLTQTQVTGGAYALNSSSFAFSSSLDLTTTQKASVTAAVPTAAAIRAEVDSNSTQLSALTTRLTSTRAGYLDNLSGGAVMLASSYTAPDNTTIGNAYTAAAVAASASASAATDTQTLLSRVTAAVALAGTAPSWYSAPVDVSTNVTAIKAKTDNLPAAPAAVGDIPTAVQNADALLARNVAGGSSTGRTVSQALFALRNKVSISGTTMTVYSTDDTTPSWTSALTTDSGALPIIASDPTG